MRRERNSEGIQVGVPMLFGLASIYERMKARRERVLAEREKLSSQDDHERIQGDFLAVFHDIRNAFETVKHGK
jgi:hypothetical protein